MIGLGLLELFHADWAAGCSSAPTSSTCAHTNSYTPAYRVMRWVRANDLGDYYIRHNPNNAWHHATISNNLRYLDVWYHFADIRSWKGRSTTAR